MEATQVRSDLKRRQLKGLLFSLQAFLEGQIEEVDKAYALNEIGEKTDLTRSLELFIEKPLDQFVDSFDHISEFILEFLHKVATNHFIIKKDLIQDVYYLNDRSVSYYSIILKNDNFENREELNKFLDLYEEEGVSEKFRIIFNFIDKDMFSGLINPKKIDL